MQYLITVLLAPTACYRHYSLTKTLLNSIPASASKKYNFIKNEYSGKNEHMTIQTEGRGLGGEHLPSKQFNTVLTLSGSSFFQHEHKLSVKIHFCSFCTYTHLQIGIKLKPTLSATRWRWLHYHGNHQSSYTVLFN